MILQDILRVKGSTVYTISPGARLSEVVQTLVRHNVGSLVVCRPGSGSEIMMGIVTERDILRACAKHGHAFECLTVADVMTRDVLTGVPGESVEETMGLMTSNRVRHLPLIEDGRLVGIISIGDVVKAQHDSLSMENHYLKSYIHG